jgi:hypothetical protein
VIHGVVREHPNVAGNQLKPFGEKEDWELPTGNVLSVRVPSIVTRAIYVTKVAANLISQKQNGNARWIPNVRWVFVRDLNVLNVEARKIALLDGLVTITYVLKAAKDQKNVLEINQFALVRLAIALNVQVHLIVLTVSSVIITIVYGLVVEEMITYVLWVTIVTFRNVLLGAEIMAIALLVGLIAVRQRACVKYVLVIPIARTVTTVLITIAFGSGLVVAATITSAQKVSGAQIMFVSKDVRMMLTALMVVLIAVRQRVNAKNAMPQCIVVTRRIV